MVAITVILFVLLVGFIVVFSLKITNLENENSQLTQSIQKLRNDIVNIEINIKDKKPEPEEIKEMTPYEFAENVMKGIISIEDELRK